MSQFAEQLREYKQEHLLQFWDELSDDQKKILETDLSQLNFKEILLYFERAISSASSRQDTLDDKIKPVPGTNVASVSRTAPELLDKYEQLGLEEIANGQTAILLMAGGQGTRLGVTYPKGMYNVGLPSNKTLFQLQAERILCLQRMAEAKFNKSGTIVWYILTSEATHNETIMYLKENNYFGLNEQYVKAFKQGMLPCFTFDGKIILDEKYIVSKAPDGNGGVYKALKVEGILDDMLKRGIRSVHAHSVDNILIKVADPIFIGYCLYSKADCGVKVVEKSCPTEPVGIVCKVDNHYRVVEYTEIKKETAELCDANGRLVYNAANICNHYFTVDFLNSIANIHETELDLHVAKKKIPYIDRSGNKCKPDKPNGIKIEKFVFDVFKFSNNFAVFESFRECEFSPLKNSDSAGQDCPRTARSDVLKLHKKWLLDAGAQKVEGDVEISSLLSYAGENLKPFVQGRSFKGPFVVES